MTHAFVLAPVLLVLAACVHAPPAAETGQSRAQALLESAKAACGGDNWERVQGWHESGEVELPGGMRASYESWSSMHSLKSANRAFVGAQQLRHIGFDGTSLWRVGPDGGVVRDSDPATVARQRRDTYISSFGYFLPDRFPASADYVGQQRLDGISYDVVRMTPVNAAPVDLWLDPQTHHVARFVADGEYAALSDYRMFDGVCTATVGRQGDGDPTHDIVLHVQAVSIDPVADSVFSPPS